MAGDASETVEWINHYDRHASELISTTMTMANALARYGDALAATGYNLGLANRSNPAPERPTQVGSVFDGKERTPPSTAKGDNGSGVETTVAGLLEALGKIPNGDTTKLGNAADAWKAFAQHTSITEAPARLSAVINKFEGDHPNLDDILRNLNTLHDGAQGIGQGTLAIGSPLADYNSALGEMRSDIHDEVLKTELELTVVLGLAVAFSVFAGAGAVAGAVAGGGIIASAVTVIRATILRSRILRIVGFIGGIATAATAAEAFKPIPDLSFQAALAAIASITVKMADDDKPAGTGNSTNTPGTSEYERRIEELAKDPAKNGASSPQSKREAEVGLQAEHDGSIPGPITRAQPGPNGEDQGEFIDSNNERWDVKSSPDSQPGYRPGAGQPIPNPQTDEQFTKMIDKDIATGENVLLDPDGMSAARRAHLDQLVANNPNWRGKVVWGR
ncbi:hypothetical protein ACLMAJ_00930 [Nocardia sp. KC 131]|uniref:hypothetical protein n=1 Tax=Nocardia arseniciresistens TaxID=3392119 RepID=UPI00398EC016